MAGQFQNLFCLVRNVLSIYKFERQEDIKIRTTGGYINYTLTFDLNIS